MFRKITLSITILAGMAFLADAQVYIDRFGNACNENEADVPEYTLPDPLAKKCGRKITTVKAWEKKRPSVLGIFEDEMYGHAPGRPEGLHFELACPDELIYEGKVLRRSVRICIDDNPEHSFVALIHLPADASAEHPVPMFEGINLFEDALTPGSPHSYRWPVEYICGEGFGLATVFHSSIEKDVDFTKVAGGVRDWYGPEYDWGAIAAWAWGLSRVLDYLETCPEIDATRVAVIGHSRGGKTALWAGATDRRFAMVCSNCSGCCGAAISRRVFGENFKSISQVFPYWFTPNFYKYADNENAFPADQHWLASLIAPRPLYIGSAIEDLWADPRGEWLTAVNVGPVYELYGKQGVSGREPELDVPDAEGTVAYRVRTGIHSLLTSDWYDYMDFAKKHLK